MQIISLTNICRSFFEWKLKLEVHLSYKYIQHLIMHTMEWLYTRKVKAFKYNAI